MAAEKKRIGRQTPTKSFVLPYKKSLSDEAVALYSQTGRTAMEWQSLLLKDIMAVNNDGCWTHMTVGYSIPRRNGKTEDVYMREIWGLHKGEQILHTAHENSTSHASFESLVDLLNAMGYEEKKDYIKNSALGNERITMIETKGVIKYRTRTKVGGLGLGFDLLVVDEAQEYTDTHRSALEYTISSSQNPQAIMLGTPPTQSSKGTVFVQYRDACLSGSAEDSMWAEWSIEQIAEDRTKTDLWYETNPSLGQTLPERNVRRELSQEEIDFNIQRLGVWLTYSQSSAITEPEWEHLKCDKLPAFTGRLFAGIKYGKDNRNVALSVAVRTDDGRIFVEALDCRPISQGNGWLIDFLQQADVEKVIIDGANGQSIFVEEMKDCRVSVKAVLPTVAQVIEANTLFTRGLAGDIAHSGQLSLAQAATHCEKRAIGTNGGFGYQSQSEDIDVALLDSAIFAYWGCSTTKKVKKQRISY